jgi:hypothetical protein
MNESFTSTARNLKVQIHNIKKHHGNGSKQLLGAGFKNYSKKNYGDKQKNCKKGKKKKKITHLVLPTR